MIGYVLKMYPRFSETFILAEILEMEAADREITVISLKKPNDGRFHEDLARVRAEVRYLPERATGHPWRFLSSHGRAFRRSPLRYLSALGRALRWLPASWKGFLRAPLIAEQAAAAGCERLHAHFASLPAISTLFAAHLMGVPFTFTAHAKDIYHRSRSRRMIAALLRHAERTITVTDYNRQVLEKLGDGQAAPITRIYNHVDTRRFAPSTPAATPVILAVGRLVEKKGFEHLVEACALLRRRGIEFHCRIIGKGPLAGALREQIERLDVADRVSLEGPRSRAQLQDLLPRAWVLAAPCVIGADRNRDGLPTVILEAMACGVAVVSTPVTGIPEAVQDGQTGLLVPEGDPGALADAIWRLLADAPLRRRLGRAARERVIEHFDTRKNVRQLARLLGESQDPPPPLSPGRLKESEALR
ncbi:MAG: glycosyltransferase [Acidobacteriota bacterium]|nr:glycosyltransferase [Acidobacteriota bacterium]